MKAFRPPPIMPTRRRPPLSPSTAVAWTIGSAFDAEQVEIGRAVSSGLREVVERAVRHFDDMIGDELGALTRRHLGMLQAAFPFVNGPAGEIIRRELREDRLEIDLAVAERAVTPCALEPTFIAAINALLRGRIELGVLDMKHLDAIVIGVDEAQIVHALLDVVTGVVIDVAALMTADRVEEHVESVTVEDVLAGVDFEAEVDAVLVIDVEDRLPATALFREAFLDQPRRPLRIGIEIRPGERAGEAHVLVQPKASRNASRRFHLVGGPQATLFRIAANGGRALTVEHGVISRMNRHHLALKMGREFADRNAYVG